MSAPYRCGPRLERCCCLVAGPVALSPEGMDTRHLASVARARAAGRAGDAAESGAEGAVERRTAPAGSTGRAGWAQDRPSIDWSCHDGVRWTV